MCLTRRRGDVGSTLGYETRVEIKKELKSCDALSGDPTCSPTTMHRDFKRNIDFNMVNVAMGLNFIL